MHYTVNIADIERALIALGGEAKAKAIQYLALQTHCAGVVPENYQHEKSFRQTIQRKMEDYCPQALGFDATKNGPKFIRIGHSLYRHAAGSSQKDFPAIEEVEKIEALLEGGTKAISVNHFLTPANGKLRQGCGPGYILMAPVARYFGKSVVQVGTNHFGAYAELYRILAGRVVP